MASPPPPTPFLSSLLSPFLFVVSFSSFSFLIFFVCSKTAGGFIFASATLPLGPAGNVQILAVASPLPLANIPSLFGFHAQTKTSPKCPSNVVTSSWLTSNSWFTSSKPPFFPPAAANVPSIVFTAMAAFFLSSNFLFSAVSSSSIARFRSSADISLLDFTSAFKASTGFESKSLAVNTEKFASISSSSLLFLTLALFPSPLAPLFPPLLSFKFASSSKYCNPFCTNATNAPAGMS
mmetsp:Transcript_7431/g.23183  ORF Transcript_7431/g.23183 Transcript_7431/m.23183 type:complete len:236 (-) Transcript_7431:3262-3969(-)